MPSRLVEIFEDEKLVEKIKKRLPYLFQLAELESSKGGKVWAHILGWHNACIVTLKK